MPYGMYVAAAGAQAQNQRLKVLTNNLANVDTPGFKREIAVFQAQHAEAIEQGLVEAGSKSLNDLGGGVSLVETVTDFEPGAFRETGVPTDLAIPGTGFFLVEKDGQQMLTRAGNFHFSPSGQFLTEQGYALQSDDGEPITIDPALPWRVFENASIAQAGDRIPISLVKPRSLGDLVKVGQNLFSPLADVTPVPPEERQVRQGYLEQSTVKPAQEMVELIETSRAYEANVRMIQNQDHMLGTLVNRVLRQ